MKTRTYEGVLVALLPQRGEALVEVLRDAASRVLGERDRNLWTIEFGHLRSPAGGVAFRLSSASEPFPWRDGGAIDLARAISELGPGRCWALALEKVQKHGEVAGWAEGAIYDRGAQVTYEDAAGPSARNDLLAWFGEELALSENEVLAVLESCDQTVGVIAGDERFEDEVDQALARARREFQRYRQLKEGRERGK
jgi:hypothetical protein